ncbi:MAG: 30S ribosomal protein S12 methylthiotransferase RimO [Christensenellaceae bacterium]|nr:30S ribosomal protein S12 methylthiotransferase RimO [Christensenellaceae bacterium]
MTTPRKVGMISLGCNKNRVDSETALGLLSARGYELTGDPAQADILMVNTCGFIGPAKEESIDAILDMARYKTEGRCRLLVVTGCLAQRYEKDLMAEIPEIDLLLGVNQYDQLPELIEKALGGQRGVTFCGERFDFFEHDRVLTTPGYSAYIRIGDGCDNRCTFCAIPLIRGPHRSRREGDVLAEMERLAKAGVREHILVAQDTTRYGTDWQAHSALPELMSRAAKIEGVDWLRVLYCYPDETDERLLDVIAGHDNICKYLDLPIQHINDEVLRRMHRRGTSADIRRCLKLSRERGLTLRTSIIVGFPGETEDQFKELLDFLEEAQFDRLGAFAYSAEEDTPAARMTDQIPEEMKQERLDRLMTLQAGISLKRNQARVGTVEKVLVTDIGEDGTLLGRSQREAPETDGEILFTAKGSLPEIGSFVDVRLTKADTYDLMGVMV